MIGALGHVVIAAAYVVTSTADSGAGTLRQAITSANANAGADTITFSIGSGVQKITPATPLPVVTDPVMIDGTAPAAFPTQVVAIYGTNAGGDGLVLSNHTGSIIENLVVTDCQAPGAAAIHLQGGGSHTVQGCLVGTDATGEFPLSNQIGILIDGASSANHVGGIQPGQRNVVSGNTLDAIALDATTGNVILGNLVGLDANGTMALGNAANGISVHANAPQNTIGGASAGARNVIAGQNGSCIELDSSGNVVQGNYLGTSASGLDALTLTGNGIYVLADGNSIGGSAAGEGNLISGCSQGPAVYVIGSSTTILGNRIGTNANGTSGLANGDGVILIGNGNTVGGTTTGAGNLISGNNNWAIELQGEANVAQGNLIGTDATGTTPLSNFGGVWIQGNANTVGGAATGAGNVIDAAQQQGIFVQGSGNTIQGNRIGVATAGTANALGNSGNAIEVHGGAYPDAGGAMGQNVVGGTAAGEGNVIANSGAAGVAVLETGATIEGNSIYDNARLGIDLGGDSVTMNHPEDLVDGGPNGWQNFPVATMATTDGTSTFVSGTLNSTPAMAFHVEVFASPAGDPSGYGQGETLVGVANVTTDSSGNTGWMVTLPSVLSNGSVISTTATNALGETSEFGPDLVFGVAGDGGSGDGGASEAGPDAQTAEGGSLDAGGDAARAGADGGGPSDASTGDVAPGADAAGSDAMNDAGEDASSGRSGSSGGCGCRESGASAPSPWPMGLLLVLALGAAGARRRRR